MNQFKERYKLTSTTELLKILENSTDYQPLAVEAAKAELVSRNLSEDELTSAREELEVIKQEYEQKEQYRRDFLYKIKDVVIYVWDYLNPVKESTAKADKLINIISIVFGFIAVLRAIKEFGMLRFMFSGYGEWDFNMVLSFLPLFLIIGATILFWTRKKIGWILLCTYISFLP